MKGSWVDGWIDTYCKELIDMIMWAGKPEICTEGQQTGNSGAHA